MLEIPLQNVSRNGALLKSSFNHLYIPRILFSFCLVAEVLSIPIYFGWLIGEKALEIISITYSLDLFWYGLACFFLKNIGMLVARARGENNYVLANRIFTSLLFCFGLIYFIAWLLFYFFLPEVLSCYSLDKEGYSLALSYYKIAIAYFPILYFLTAIENVFTIDGRALFFAMRKVLQTILSIILPYIFVSILDYGIQGIAYAIILKFFLAFSWSLTHFFSKSRTVFIDFSGLFKFKEVAANLIKCVKLGLPSSMSSLIEGTMASVLNNFIGMTSGSPGLAVFGVLASFTEVFYQFDSVVETVDSLMCSLLYGEKDYFGIKSVLIYSVKCGLLVSGLVCIVFCAFPQNFAGLFNFTDPNTIELFTYSLYIFSLYLFLSPLFSIVNAYLISVEKEGYSLYISLLQPVLAPIIAYCFKDYFGSYSVYFGFFCSLLFCISSLLLYALKKGTFFPTSSNKAIYYSFTLTEKNLCCVMEDVEDKLSEEKRQKVKLNYLIPLILEEIFSFIKTKQENYRRAINVDLRLEKKADKINITLSCSGNALASVDILQHPELLQFNDINQRILNSITSGITYDRVMYLNYIRLQPDKKETLLELCFLLDENNISYIVGYIQNKLAGTAYSNRTAAFLSILLEEFFMFLFNLNRNNNYSIHVTIAIRKNNDFFCISLYDDGIEYDKEVFFSLKNMLDNEILNIRLLQHLAKNCTYERVVNHNYFTITTPIME